MKMKYILMMNATQATWEAFLKWPKETLKAHIDFMHQFNDKLKERGELVSVEGLTPPSEARIVRARKDGPPVIDGVFAETKEFVAGWWLVDVANAERAYELAAQASAAPGPDGPLGIPIEVRAVGRAPEV
jgi:hypothetical protein